MSTERILNRRRFERVRAPAIYGASRGKEQSPPWHRRPAGGMRRYHRFRTPSDNESPNFESEFNSDVDDNYAVERSAKSFPPRGPSENPFRYGFKHEVLKVSAEEVQAESGETQVYFKAVAIVGDFNGNVGLGVDVAMKPTRSAKGAINIANDNIVSIRRGHWGVHKHGLPHTIFCKVNSAIDDLQVRVNPAPRGTGITGPPLARRMLEYAGVQDAYVIVRGEEPELAILCQTILSAVKDTFTIFQDKVLQAYNVRRKEDMVTYKSKVPELLSFEQPKGSCGNMGLFTPDMVEDSHSKGIMMDENLPAIPQVFSDFVPGAKAHLTANGMDEDEDKENAPNSLGSITAEDAVADAQDADKYIEEINQISIQFEDCDVKENATTEVEINSGCFAANGSQEESTEFEGMGVETEAASFDALAGGGFRGWPPADFMGGGDNNAMPNAFNPAAEAFNPAAEAFNPAAEAFNPAAEPNIGFANAGQYPFGPGVPLQPRKRNPIPIVDPNEIVGGQTAIEA